MDYYIILDGAVCGPSSFSNLKELWKSGVIPPDTLYCTEGMSEWRSLVELSLSEEEVILSKPSTSASNLDAIKEFAGQITECFSCLRSKWRSASRGVRSIVGAGSLVGLILGIGFLWQHQPLRPHVTRSAAGAVIPESGYAWRKSADRSRGVIWSPGVAHRQFVHVRAGGMEGEWKAEPGYIFINRDSSLETRWSPGLAHPDYPHVFASSTEGEWRIEEGYRRASASPGDLRVVWTPQIEHPRFSHVLTDSREGYWLPEAGYDFLGNTLEAVWTPGIAHPKRRHILADVREGYWKAEAGYAFVQPTGELFVEWRSGSRDLRLPHLVAGQTEGIWEPEPGYTWSSGNKNNHTVRKLTQTEMMAQSFALGFLGGLALSQGASGEYAEGASSRSLLCSQCGGEGTVISNESGVDFDGQPRRNFPRIRCPLCLGTGRQ